MKRKLIRALPLLVLAFILTGCAAMESLDPAAPDTPSPYDGVVVDSLPVPAGLKSFSLPYVAEETLDPITCPDGPQQVIGALLYDGLYALDEHFEPVPLLARSYTCDQEARLYAIRLRDGVRFSDGTPLTAADVAATLERARWSPRYNGRLSDVTSVRAGDGEVFITLSSSNAAFISRLDIPIVKASTAGESVPMGTGRFVWRQAEAECWLEPNSESWRQETGPLSRISLVPCKDSDALAYAFFRREVQLVTWDLTGTVLFNATGVSSYTDAPTPIMQFVGFNTTSRLFSDPALRASLSLGVDRTKCVENHLLNHAAPAAFPLSPADSLYPADLEHPYSAESFAAAMEEAGYATGQERHATLIVSAENSFRVQAARQIAQDLSQYDVKITVKALPWTEYQTALSTGKYDLYYAECKLPADWDLTALLGNRGALNFSGYTDEALPGLLLEASISSGERRAAALRTLYLHLQQQAPFIPICFKNISLLLPDKAVKLSTPTATDPFYHLEDWAIQWAEDNP